METSSLLPDAKCSWRAIAVERAVYALIEACGVARLKRLVARHVDPAHSESPGVTNLFLYTRKPRTPLTSRFIKVKRPREPHLPRQVEELEF